MALTADHHSYRNTLPTNTNYSIHRITEFPLSLSSQSSPMKMPSDERQWFHFVSESATKPIKDEAFDCDMTSTTTTPIETMEYTVIDFQHVLPHAHHPHTTATASLAAVNDRKLKRPRKKTFVAKRMLTMANIGNPLANFDRQAGASPNQTSKAIKQQPFSPPPYHAMANGFFNHHHRQHTTPSPDHEPISPLSNPLTENSLTSNLVPPSNIGGASTAAEDKRRCAVCSDIASGYHYGVWSCEGCKAFFKRSIQGTNEYICPATNTCTIDKHRRKSCQACRLRRCYEVGMTKGTTRRERKYRKKAVSVCKITSTSSNSNAMNNPGAGNHEQGLSVVTSLPSSGTPSISQMNNNLFSSPQLQATKTSSDSTRIPITSADFITTLSQASRLNLPAKVNSSRPLTDQYFLQLLAKIFDQELVVLINWAKAMPGYTESLTLDQQVTIIEQSWLDTLILDIIERSLERNDDILHFAPDFIISRNRDLSSPGLGAICTSLFNILQAFKDPRTTHEEFIALKATILINSIPATITATKSFRMLTNQIYQALQYTSDSNPSVYHDNFTRHFTLLLQLPHIKTLSLKLIRLFVDMRASDLLPQADLLLEMLDAQEAPDLSSTFLSPNTENNGSSSRPPSSGQDFLTNPNANESHGASVTVPPAVNNSLARTDYPTSNNFNPHRDANEQTTGSADLNGQANYRATSSPMIYTSTPIEKRSSATPPMSFYKHSHTDPLASQPPANMHFPMNNLSY